MHHAGSFMHISSEVKYTIKPVLHTTVTVMNNIKLTLRIWKIIVKKTWNRNWFIVFKAN